MSNAFDDDFLAACNDEFDSAPTKRQDPKYARKTFTCEACNGTGLWRGGRINSYGNNKCNVCHGRGQLVTSPADRLKAKVQREDRKAAKADEARKANIEALGGEDRFKVLLGAADWSSFAGSLIDQHHGGRSLSPKQLASANGMIDKLQAKAAERAEAIKAAPVVDLSPIKAMFDAAVKSGYKAPKYRAEGLQLSRAKDNSRNPGCLYIVDEEDTYLGKLDPQMKLHVGYNHDRAEVEAKLLAIAADPSGAAVRYGRRTGRCSCCGRELTKHASIEAGIGPICAARWALG